jgi:hypothetical protein
MDENDRVLLCHLGWLEAFHVHLPAHAHNFWVKIRLPPYSIDVKGSSLGETWLYSFVDVLCLVVVRRQLGLGGGSRYVLLVLFSHSPRNFRADSAQICGRLDSSDSIRRSDMNDYAWRLAKSRRDSP